MNDTEETPKRVRIVIADDQPLFADGLRMVLESRAPEFEVVGIAPDGLQAVSMAGKLGPDVILMDVRMPEMDGVEATRIIHERYPRIKILILTTFDDDEYVQYSLHHGAIGYLLKNRPPVEIIESLRALGRGILQIDPAVSAKILGMNKPGVQNSDEVIRRLRTLTNRECEVLRLLVGPNRIVQIAEKLGIAEQTVRNHVSNIYFKLDIHDRIQVLNYVSIIKYYLEHQE